MRHGIKVMMLAALSAIAAAPPAELNDKSFESWRDWIRPKAEERVVESIAWRPTLWDGVMDAQKEDKPILMWAMNGHPLACT